MLQVLWRIAIDHVREFHRGALVGGASGEFFQACEVVTCEVNKLLNYSYKSYTYHDKDPSYDLS